VSNQGPINRGVLVARLNKESIDRFYDYDIHIETRTLYIGSVDFNEDGESGTDGAMAARAIKGLHLLDTSAPLGDKPITIIMNNVGGCEYHGMAIYDAIRACKNHVTIIGRGHLMSMGSIIFQAADKRVMAPHCTMMIHYGTWEVPNDHPKVVYAWAEEGKRFDKIMEDLYLSKIQQKHPDYTQGEVKAICLFDRFYSAQQAVEIGLCDEVEA